MKLSGHTLQTRFAWLTGCLLFVTCSSLRAAEQTDATGPAHGLTGTDPFDYPAGPLRNADGGTGWKRPWKLSRTAAPSISAPAAPDQSQSAGGPALKIHGTGSRNNPLRRELANPLTQKEVFVRFDLHYRNGTAPDSSKVDPEFFVFWLDRLAGGDGSTHASNVPNIGIHIADRGPQQGHNVFMIRLSPAQTAWTSVELQNNRNYRIVGRCTKSGTGAQARYDRFDLWIDPAPSDLQSPDATLVGTQSLNLIRWVGFSTGAKTEPADQIHIQNLMLGTSWRGILNESALSLTGSRLHSINGVTWDQPVDFKRDIFPLLKARCFDCHSGETPDSGYRLDVHREIQGYSSGEVLAVPGRSRHSRLIQALMSESETNRMPPDGNARLNDRQIAMLAAWIDQGMDWDDELLPTPKRETDHWAFQPVVRPAVPAVADPAWLRTPVDAFIARAHAEAGVAPAAEASKVALVRRIHLDLTGLPPTPEEVTAFLNDRSPQAWERLVDRLLKSPHYGERWARYWLDLARWAESQGYQHDFVRPYAWRYRDYVVDSFNTDKPYDRFLKEQLAGDELQPYSDENLIATGFLGAARISGNQEDNAIQRNDVLVDIVNATGSVMLGLTLECAQCHNHKFDPITQRDYYRLQAFFVRGQLGNLSLRNVDAANPTDLERWIPGPAFAYYSKEVRSLTKKKLFSVTKQPHTWGYLSAATGNPGIERYPVVNRRPIPWHPATLKNAEARILIRGDAGNPGPDVKAGWPEVLGSTLNPLDNKTRSALADWMARPTNPLVARVWVNRLWQYHFGRGLVATASDFGVKGARPSHPRLLDWLAVELLQNGWSTKHIHRQIVLSSTYRQQRRHNAAHSAIDPGNRLLWNWPRRRLEAEAIRDSVLVATGELDRTVGGVSIPPEREAQKLRRTLYLFQQRSRMPPVMEMFDAPEGIASCSRRSVSTVALQPLFMLNSQFMADRATALAESVRDTAGLDPGRQVELAFQRTLCRNPDTREQELAMNILQRGPQQSSGGSETSDTDTALMQLCHALLNLNEFVYIP